MPMPTTCSTILTWKSAMTPQLSAPMIASAPTTLQSAQAFFSITVLLSFSDKKSPAGRPSPGLTKTTRSCDGICVDPAYIGYDYGKAGAGAASRKKSNLQNALSYVIDESSRIAPRPSRFRRPSELPLKSREPFLRRRGHSLTARSEEHTSELQS